MENLSGLVQDISEDSFQSLLNEEPQLILRFFTYGITLERRDTHTGLTTEYVVNPDSLASALTSRITFSTGILSHDTIMVNQIAHKRIITEYRKPQLTGIWLEGTDTPLRIPMPGLLMIRITTEGRTPNYRIFAVRERPRSLACRLYACPTPNTGNDGICWGTVATPSAAALAGTSLREDWAQFLGSRFANHTTSEKSKKHRRDIRALYLELEQTKARTYPKNDLIDTGHTLQAIMKQLLSSR